MARSNSRKKFIERMETDTAKRGIRGEAVEFLKDAITFKNSSPRKNRKPTDSYIPHERSYDSKKKFASP